MFSLYFFPVPPDKSLYVKQYHQLSYEELAIHLVDSNTFMAFCRLNGAVPSKSALQWGISRITAATWEKINRGVLVSANRFCFYPNLLPSKRRSFLPILF